jgi:hypothetical protein
VKRALALIALLVVASLGSTACGATSSTRSPIPDSPDRTAAETPTSDVGGGEGTEPGASEIAWLDTELTDVVTGERYRISDFQGRPVLLHAFAVW